ncbi:hypothetical protein Tco_1253201 [Tanacetum coccineum]
MSEEERLADDTKKAIKASKLATRPQQTAGSSKGAGLMPKVPDEPTVETDDEENKHDNDETQRDEFVHEDEYVHTDDDERTESDNEDQAMDDVEKNDEDKAEEEKDTDQEPIQDEQAKYEESTDAEITSMVDVQIQQEIPAVLSTPLLNVLAFVVPPTLTTLTPPPIPTLTTPTTTTIIAPSSTTAIPNSETFFAIQLREYDLEKEVKELKQVDHFTALRASIRSEKRQQDDRDQDPPSGPDQGLKKIKTSKDVKPSKKPKFVGSSKDTTQSQPKSTSTSVQSVETIYEAADADMSMNQGDDLGKTNEQPNVEADPKYDWFKKSLRAPTHDPEWNKGKSVDNEPAQDWLNDLANAKKTPLTFDDLISTPINFSAFAMNHLKISKLTKANLV